MFLFPFFDFTVFNPVFDFTFPIAAGICLKKNRSERCFIQLLFADLRLDHAQHSFFIGVPHNGILNLGLDA
jgi:hypothetical protein